jgi:hypothetical protein
MACRRQNAREQFPKRGQNALGGRTHGGSVPHGDVLLQQSPLGRGVFLIRFNVDTEVAVALRVVELVMPNEPSIFDSETAGIWLS